MNRLAIRTVIGSAIVACAGAAHAGPVAVPELIWYTFEEAAGSATTANLAVPGTGFANAPVLGHQLGGGSLTSIGGSSASAYVDTGWDGATGNSSFTLYFELTNPSVGNGTLEYFFGNASVGQRAFDDGVAGAENIAFRFGGGAYATAFGASAPGSTHEVGFVYDASVGEGYAYVDAVLVDTITGLSTNVTPGLFKVGGYSTSASMQAGTQLHDFRVYNRALSASEFIPAPATLTALIVPALMAGRRRR